MSDAISRLLAERERQDHGLNTTLLVSLTGHFGLAALAVVLPMLLPREPPLQAERERLRRHAARRRRDAASPGAAGARARREAQAGGVRRSPAAARAVEAAAQGRAAPERAAAPRRQDQAPADTAARTRRDEADHDREQRLRGNDGGREVRGLGDAGSRVRAAGSGRPDRHRDRRRLVPRERAAEDLDDLEPADQDGLHAVGRSHVHDPARRQRHGRPAHASRPAPRCSTSRRSARSSTRRPFGPLPREYGQKSFTIRALFKPTF